MRLDEVIITLPIIRSRKSSFYALILTDSAEVEHYFNFDGSYDGCSSTPSKDSKTGTSLN